MHKAHVKCTWGRASSPFLVAWLETCKNWDFLVSKTVRNKLPSLISHPYYGIPNRLEQTTLRQQPEWFISSISHPKIILFIDWFPDSSVGKVSQFDSWGGKIPWRRDRLPTPVFLGFPYGSAGKESACNKGDLGSTPGLGWSPGEGKGYPLQYSGLETV